MGGCGGLQRRESTACTHPGLKLRSPWNPEESPAGNPNTGLHLQTRGVTNPAACLGMSSCTACTPPGLRFRSAWNPEEESPVGNPNTILPLQTRGGVTNSAACLGMSACNAFTPPGLRLTTWEGVVVLKELIFQFLLWEGWWS